MSPLRPQTLDVAEHDLELWILGFYLSSADIISIHRVPDSNARGLGKMGLTFTFVSEADGLNELV